MSNEPIISEETMTALLGRSLNENEQNNYNLYYEIAILRLNDLLCLQIQNMTSIPADLQLLIARCFAVVTLEQSETASHGINKKQVEDFSISYEADASNPMVAFVEQNSALLDKYSECQASIRSGKVCDGCISCI